VTSLSTTNEKMPASKNDDLTSRPPEPMLYLRPITLVFDASLAIEDIPILIRHRPSIVHAKHCAIGTMVVIQINRNAAHGQFQDLMEAHDGILAQYLFDMNGDLHNIFVRQSLSDIVHAENLLAENMFYIGSECWSSELNS
jgi:hypothetical protein